MGTSVLSFSIGRDYVLSSLCPQQAPNIVVSPWPIESIHWINRVMDTPSQSYLAHRFPYLPAVYTYFFPESKKGPVAHLPHWELVDINERGVVFLRTWTYALFPSFLTLLKQSHLLPWLQKLSLYMASETISKLVTPQFASPRQISSLICLVSFHLIAIPCFVSPLECFRKKLTITYLKWNSWFPLSH